MNDYKFAAFIVNRSEYDNGNRETSGTELSFPTDAETVKRTFAVNRLTCKTQALIHTFLMITLAAMMI